MKRVCLIGLVVFFASACSNNESAVHNRVGTMSEQPTPLEAEIAGYDANRGAGKFADIEIAENLDAKLAAKGEAIFSVKCGSCHKLSDERLVGPGFKGVSERRSATWMMNFLTNTDAMIDLDPELQAQLEICMVRMPDQQLSDEDARALYEFMRKNDGVNE